MSTGHMPLPTGVDTTYPPAPWNMHGQLWLSLFRVREGDHPERSPGVYGVALVKYEDPSPLTYGELLVARPVKEPVKGVTITDIWVDSPNSVAGGRDLWAIPKDLGDFDISVRTRGPLTHASWGVSLDGRPIVSATFTDVSRAAPRLGFKGRTWQQRADGEEVTALLSGSSKALPARSRWTFAPDGPLGWLTGKRSLASFRQADFRMSFG
ncbi:MAG: acetoacetate decarboxylase family protein [Nocardioidaceae bacterium]|nr:acetoacetate decarboxylase family protein [Nocardioidaceae bacterium]